MLQAQRTKCSRRGAVAVQEGRTTLPLPVSKITLNSCGPRKSVLPHQLCNRSGLPAMWPSASKPPLHVHKSSSFPPSASCLSHSGSCEGVPTYTEPNRRDGAGPERDLVCDSCRGIGEFRSPSPRLMEPRKLPKDPRTVRALISRTELNAPSGRLPRTPWWELS